METTANPLVQQVSVKRVGPSDTVRLSDAVAVEEPLGIRLQYWFKGVQRTESLALTMRTPGHDRELAAGFLFSEGIIRNFSDLVAMHALGGKYSNEVLVEVAPDVDVELWRLSRSTFVNSSCGICGKRSSEDLEQRLPAISADPLEILPAAVHRLPAQLTEWQRGFAQTGGLHAAALADDAGTIQAVYEDIGRHNALDKLIGASYLAGKLPFARQIVFLSSRSSFELVAKAAVAGASVLATVGSPSTLAVDAARRCGLTLLGFVRGTRFNIYSAEWRIHS